MENQDQQGTGDIYPCAPAPPVDIKLFVARIPKTFEEPEIRSMFEEFGKIKEVAVIRDRNTSAHKNCAFVRMESISQADAAIRSLNNQRIVDPTLGAALIKYASGEPERLGFTSMVGDGGQDDAKLFVGSIPRTCDESYIRELFAPYGIVDEVHIIKDNATGAHRGCAFVKMAYKEQAIYAIKMLNTKRTCEGCIRPMEVRFAEPKKAPQTSGFSNARPGAFTPPSSSTLALPAAATSNLNPRQAGCWREYFSAQGKPYYYNEQTGHTQWHRPPEFETESAMASTAQATGPPGANLFIFHIPNEWTQHDLVRTFSQFGNIISAKVAVDKASGRHRGFAFVSYDAPESASQAIVHMNGFTIMGKRLKVSLKKGEEAAFSNALHGATSNLRFLNGANSDAHYVPGVPRTPTAMPSSVTMPQGASTSALQYATSSSGNPNGSQGTPTDTSYFSAVQRYTPY